MLGSARSLLSWLALPVGALATQVMLASPVLAQAAAPQACAGNPNAIGVARDFWCIRGGSTIRRCSRVARGAVRDENLGSLV